MATITTLARAGGAYATAGRTPFVIDNVVDFAAAATAKGGALAAADIIEALNLPAKCQILSCGAEVITEHTGTSTDLTLDIGITGGNTDFVADGFDYDGAAVGAVTSPVVAELPLYNGSADTVDILLATMTGTTTGGKIRVWACVVPVAGRAQEANEVDRDVLA
jgi:hypothetical protein